MLLTVNRKELKNAVSLAASVARTRTTIPQLNAIQVTANGNCRVSATDGETAVAVDCEDFRVEYAGTVALLPAGIKAAINSGKSEHVVIARQIASFSNGATYVAPDSAVITDGGFASEVVGVEPLTSDYAYLPPRDTAAVTMSAVTLREMLGYVAPSQSKDPTRFSMLGVHLACDAGTLSLAATDGHRLSMAKQYVGTAPQIAGANVPTDCIKLLLTVLRKASGTVSLAVRTHGGNEYFVTWCENVTLSARILDAKFPDFAQILPHKHNLCVTVDALSFSAALGRAKNIANPERSKARAADHPVRLSFVSDHVELARIQKGATLSQENILLKGTVGYMKKFQPEDESAAAGQTGDRRSDEDCGAEDCGERAVVGFNADYLFDAVGTPTRTHTFTADCPGDVTLYFTDPLSPAVVSDRFDRATVVMPIRI